MHAPNAENPEIDTDPETSHDSTNAESCGEPETADYAALRPLRETAHMDLLPSTAHDLIEVVGLQATIDMVSAFGGTEIPLPASASGSSRVWSELQDAMGIESARKLVESRFGGTRLYVPSCRNALRELRNRRVVELVREAQLSRCGRVAAVERIRRQFGLTKSYVYRLMKHAGAS